MKERLISFFDDHKVFIDKQFGFRNKHSTMHALLSLSENIRKNLDEGNFSCGVFIDLQKAFDTVDHDILLYKLNHYGIRGTANNWFRSYLKNRRQSVIINGKSSATVCFIKHGVPQGSVLGPLLFLLYINDLCNAIFFSEVFHFADDTSLVYSAPTLKKIRKKINIDLKMLQHWLNANKIALNVSKTEVVLFRQRRKVVNYDLNLRINGVKLHLSPFVTYLGVQLDCFLNWNQYISRICVKLRKTNGILSRLRHYCSLHVLTSVYNSLFFSHIAYACQIWGQCSSPNINRISLLQKTALRLMTFSNFRHPSKSLLYRLNFLSISDYVKLQNIILVFQILIGVAPVNIRNIFNLTYVESGYPTRASYLRLLNRPAIRTKIFGIQSVRYQCVLHWNFFQTNFPQYDLSSISLSKLKSIIKNSCLSSYHFE